MPGVAEAIEAGWRNAAIGVRHRAMCAFAERLTLRPQEAAASEIDALRAAGLEDREILDVVQIIAYFNYVNRIASGLGVPLEPERGGPGTP